MSGSGRAARQDGERREVPEDLTLQCGLSFAEMRRRIGLAYAAGGMRHRVLAFYLSEVDLGGLQQLEGCRTVAQWAGRTFGMSRREARDLLVAGHALRELQETDRAFAEGRLCWSKLRELVKVAAPDTEREWLEFALAAHIDELVLEVRLCRKGERPRAGSRRGLPQVRLHAGADVPPDVYAKWEQWLRKLRDGTGREMKDWECLDALLELGLASSEQPGAENTCYDVAVALPADGDDAATVETDDGPVPLDELTATLLACDAGCACHGRGDAGADHEADRRMPARLRKRVIRRDGKRCKCCGSRYSLQVHHVIPWSQGGRSTLSNLVTVCRRCHALIHAGLLVVTGKASGCRFEAGDAGAAAALPPEYRPAEQLAVAPPEPDPLKPVRIDTVPEAIDQAWWRRHAHLLKANGHGGFELTPGRALEQPQEIAAAPAAAAAAAAGGGTMCQPRPARLAEVIGQRQIVAEIRRGVQAALARGEPMSPVMLEGPPGLGKTSIARAAAAELGARLHAAAGAALGSPPALVKLLAGLGEGDVLFVDEIHALPSAVAETLYEALEDRTLEIVLSGGSMTRTVTLKLAPFSFFGATTQPGLLPAPFLSRFVYRARLRFYDTGELARVIAGASSHFGCSIEPAAAELLGRAARGTPRAALALFKRACDDAVLRGSTAVTAADAEALLKRSGIDGRGLGPVDRAILDVLGREGPVGVLRLAQLAGVDVVTLEREHEPYLVHQGLMTVTPQGRVAVTSRSGRRSGCRTPSSSRRSSSRCPCPAGT